VGADWGYEAQQAAEARLALCEQWRWHYDDGDPEPEEPDPSIAPYCGCDTCIVREVLAAAWPIVEQAVREELSTSPAQNPSRLEV
jgi:hypothetical protein